MQTWTSTKSRDAAPAIAVRERAPRGVQRKLAIGAPGDRFEREADRVADAVMRGGSASVAATGAPSIQRACASCEQEDEKIRAKSDGALNVGADVSSAIGQQRGGGAPLGTGERAFFEPRFGRSFAGVRIHADQPAQALAGSLTAKAFTVGGDIFFNRGEYAPGSDRGRRLIAHELTHVVQQSHGAAPMVMREPQCPSGSCHERIYKDKPFDWGQFKKEDNTEWIKKYFKQQNQRLNFFHGTRWSVAQKIPGNVKAVGGGDFAAGFYTHHDKNDKKAWFKALQWACRVARDAKEKYGGVIKFNVDAAKFGALNAKNFNLTSLSQTDYTQRQDDWIKFITAHGRQANPVFQNRPRGGVWIHDRVDPPPPLGFDTITGPFYKPLPGEASKQPAASEFQPFVEGADTLPQQVAFANKGADLLNDADTKVELKQHDCANGNIVDPPDTSAAAAAGTPSGKEVPMIE